MGFGKGKYNSYRKRTYNVSDAKRREYAAQMDEIKDYFDQKKDWSISVNLDSCYKHYPEFEIRISNHSADNQYHDLHDGYLIVNIKGSKLNFENIIENEVDEIVDYLKTIDLSKYRFVNVTNEKISLYFKGFKTKKDVIERSEMKKV